MLAFGARSTRDHYVPGDHSTIQAAIDAAGEGDTVIVAPNTYHENIVFRGPNITLTGTDSHDPTVVAATIIDGSNTGTCVTFTGSETAACVIQGFTITHGNGNNGANQDKGGGIYGGYPDSPGAVGTFATIRNNIITDNTASGSAGGIGNCDGLIENNVITFNTCGSAGGGIFHSDGTIRGNYVAYNHAGHQGGGICGGFGTIEYNLVLGNSTGDWGGGINKSMMRDPIIRHNTIVNNTADRGGGLCDNGGAVVYNCIIWGNSASISGDQVSDRAQPPIDPSFNCIQDWPAGNGNISEDPLFADPANDDYHLKSQAGRWDENTAQWVFDGVTSPCIDAAEPVSPIGDEPFPNGGIANMGAYGATARASKSYFGSLPCDTIVAGDLDGDCDISFNDLKILALHWLQGRDI